MRLNLHGNSFTIDVSLAGLPSRDEDSNVFAQVVPGEILNGRWCIDSAIGHGAMGSVFKAKDLKTNRKVAVKLLSAEHAHKKKVLARFEREVLMMASLSHPNLVSFFGHGHRGALPYLVMEYLQGLTLTDLLAKKGAPLSLGETLAVLQQLSLGLSFLHENAVVHRDIKPQNIMVSRRGLVTILDFGVVREQGNPGLTKPGAMVGTPFYMSPEQILGLEDVNTQTDVYALAAVTFELLTGRPPFMGTNNFEVLYGHKNTAVPDASLVNPRVPKNVAQVLQRGLAKDRSKRCRTVREFEQAFEVAALVNPVDLVEAFPFIVTAGGLSPTQDVPTSDDDSGLHRRKGEAQDTLHTAETTIMVMPDMSAVIPAKVTIQALHRGRQVGAQLTVDSNIRGTTPQDLLLSPGQHVVKVALPNLKPVEQNLEVEGGTKVVLQIELS